MSGLDDADREDLAAFREACRPPAGRRAANWDQLQRRIGARTTASSRWLRPAAAVLVVAAAALLWMWLRPGAATLERGERAPSMAADEVVGAVEGRAVERGAQGVGTVAQRDRSPASTTGRPATEGGELPSDEGSAGEGSTEGRGSQRPRAPERRPTSRRSPEGEQPGRPDAPARPEPTTEEAIAAEAALMRRARVALEAHRYVRVLQLIDEHEARFDAPFMAEEAAAWRAMALCGGGREQRGQRAAAAFRRAYPRSPQRASLDVLCPPDPVTDPPVPRQRPVGGL